jgi:hypothetical protein
VRVEIELITMILIVIRRRWLRQPGALKETASALHAYLRVTGYSTPVLEGSLVEAPPSVIAFPVA